MHLIVFIIVIFRIQQFRFWHLTILGVPLLYLYILLQSKLPTFDYKEFDFKDLVN